MNDKRAGPDPGEATRPEVSGMAERLIRDEFAPPVAEDPVPPPATEPTPAVAAATVGDGAQDHIHDEFSEEEPGLAPDTPGPRSRSHRTGMLAGLAVVGALLALLVIVAPGGSGPKLPPQTVHDVNSSSNGPRTAAGSVPTSASGATSTTTSNTPASTTTTTPNGAGTTTQHETITYVEVPGTTTPTTAPAATPTQTTTATQPATPTTTTTSPPSTTTTTAPHHCILGILC